MCQSCDRSKYEEMVKGPGKFEGEPAYVPYLWEGVMDGSGDETWYDSSERPIETFIINKHDIAMFPELENVAVVILWEDDNGFVHKKEFMTENEYDRHREQTEG